jgi:hypothetical protein
MTTALEADNTLIFNVTLANGLHGQPRLYSHTLTVLPDTAKTSFHAAIRALVFGQ